MASINNLLISWNFDTLTGSNASGGFYVDDVIGEEYGSAINFATSSQTFILKEDLKTNKKLKLETLEGIETITVREEDDLSPSLIKKPNNLQIMVENSMYQLISDEMLNLFASVDAYAFQYTEPSNKYKNEYYSKKSKKLKDLRRIFFSKVLNKPDIEKYIEFYKWIDSALGDMVQQLLPENANAKNTLKLTIENHILERSKFTHKLPLTTKKNPLYTSGITVFKSGSYLSGSNFLNQISGVLSGSFGETVTVKNISSRNYNNGYEYFNTAGKIINNRGNKENKTVLTTKFSAGDKLSEKNRDDSTEYSKYNTLNFRAAIVKHAYNLSQSITGSNYDNNFIQYNIPYMSSSYDSGSYVNTGSSPYQSFPSKQLQFNKNNNILVEEEVIVPVNLLRPTILQEAIEEPVIEYNLPAKHTVRIQGGLEDSLIYSPYNNFIDTFSPNTLSSVISASNKGFINYFNNSNYPPEPKSDLQTFSKKIQNLTSSVEIKQIEILHNLYPRKDLIGKDLIRKKFEYEEILGNFNLSVGGKWTSNSYNNNSAEIRTFWKNSILDRYRTRGSDLYQIAGEEYSGSINCLGSRNLSASYNFIGYQTSSAGYDFIFKIPTGFPNNYGINLSVSASSNYYDSVYCLDGLNEVTMSINSGNPSIVFTNYYMGDLTPLAHNLRFNALIASGTFAPANKYQKGFNNFRAKPEFIFNNFIGNIFGFRSDFVFNLSYQQGVDPNLKPAYNSYNDYFKNIKHKSHYYSIIPEFAVSNFESSISNQSNILPKKYLKILGRENFDALSVYEPDGNEAFITKLPKFVNNQTNKVKFVINGVKKLLPYNGFYPAQRSVQIIKNFHDGYLSSSISTSTSPAEISRIESKKQTLIQPLFGPGILFNTIKAGIAVDYPIATSSNSNLNYYNLLTASIEWSDSSYLGGNVSSSVVKNDALSYRLPFETLLDPERYYFSLYNKDKFIYYLDPTHYNYIFTSGSNSIAYPKQFIEVPKEKLLPIKLSQANIILYKYAINNYLAEIPNFFLKNSELTNFVSRKPESQFDTLEQNKNYDFKIKIEKNTNYSSFKKFSNIDYNIGEEILYGPPVQNAEYFGNPLISSSYAPFIPPYYLSGAINSTNPENIAYNEILLRYTPSTTAKPKLSDIFNGLQVISSSAFTNNYAMTNFMSLANSLKLKEQLPVIERVVNAETGKPETNTPDPTNNRWVIQTKFEVPLIDYADTVTTSSTTIGTMTYKVKETNATSTTTLKKSVINYQGIWNTLGTIPEEGQSIQLTITDEGVENSLLTAVGFEPEVKSIGTIAENKKISEGILLLPFESSIREINTGDVYRISNENNKKLFTISEDLISELLGIPNYRDLTINEIKILLDTKADIDRTNSIIDLMIKMVNYNIPKHLNWLDNKNIPPIVMYIAEFDHVLNQADLANIWQGTMPSIAENPEEQTVIIEHSLGERELFGNQVMSLGGSKLNDFDISFKVFKIKKRANNDYTQITVNPIDVNNTKIPWYTYNWPYDYFSLVELVNIQGGEVYEAPQERSNLDSLLDGLNDLDLTNMRR